MRNFFEKQDSVDISTNPFAKDLNVLNPEKKNKNSGNRLNIMDMDVLTPEKGSDEIKFIEIKMNNLYRTINEKSNSLDPVSLEKMKIEWEELRTKVYNLKKAENKNITVNNKTNVFSKSISKITTLIKMYSPKVKHIMNTFSEINKEVEDLVKGSTPNGEEEMKYRMLVNKINEASKLNLKLTNEIKCK